MGRPAALVDSDWHEQAINVIEQLARSQTFITADDLRKNIEPPEHANQIGPAFMAARAKKIITPVDYRTSKSRSRNGGSLKVWTLHPRLRKAG